MTAGGSPNPLVVVANRLPVERSAGGGSEWQRSPGGLVAALEPVVRAGGGTWIGWAGERDEELEPFVADDLHLVPVRLSSQDVELYYEGFSNATLWPLYHDVVGTPQFHREWWVSYRDVNRRFAAAAAAQAEQGAMVWVQDYQLQLVPAMLRELRPDLRIGFFDHIPFPGYEIYARLPWRGQIIDGLLGADLVGFQRQDDTENFVRAVRHLTNCEIHGTTILTRAGRRVEAGTFPISVDSAALDALARSTPVAERARRLRAEFGNPDNLLLGIDRLDYTKGIRHRMKAFGELLDEGTLHASDTVMVQVASPSREQVEEYQRLRDEVELTVGRINGDHSILGRPALHYLHQTFPIEDMAALYLAADVMLVTPLRDGMNLVAKEFVACHHDERGVLVLSEFAGAADELREAVLVNPYDIDATKMAILTAIGLPPPLVSRKMRALRQRVGQADVHHWAESFLSALAPGA